ncbi:IS110 family transposase [Ktedonobacteria bacterium brp13]|nr:IS110 family transposase [Ktedonobacteria bacterium brp13]
MKDFKGLHTHLSDEATRYQNEIQSLVVVLFPEFIQVFADPCLPNAMAVLKAYPHAQAIVEAGVEPIVHLLRSQSPVHSGRPTAQRLVALAQQSGSSGRALAGRGISLQVLCDQLAHTRENLARLETEIEQQIADDPGVKGLQQIQEFGPKTVAVLRAELGDVDRFARTDQIIAYGGMDIEIKESGRWKGKAKLSKRGSGLLRRMLYLAALRSTHTDGSAFGAYYHRLVARGFNKGSALMTVMRKMLAVAAHLLKYPEAYEPTHGLLPKNTAQQGAVQEGNGVSLAVFATRDTSSQGLTNLIAST